ncbi:transposase [Gudongella sp. SC589]|jgi:REP element-mobilizing transposase RayT|uniref:transposase n=1 Tax=Gudongella sp. SC589 TaxID=3385990 RepID=UPI003904DCE4
MPRSARKISSTGIYHVMIRGINRSPIFLGDSSKGMLLKIIEEVKINMSFRLYAYCIMDNHAHMLIDENGTSISEIMKRICGSNGNKYNKIHGRMGHLFQDRFKSECVETNAYFITVSRYILNNPVKSGLVESAIDYKWSSMREYTTTGSITDTDLLLSMYSNDNESSKKHVA